MIIYRDNIIEIFKKNSYFFDETSTHFIIRCPYCGDSKKRQDTGHLYIKKDEPVFRCNRCYYGGSVVRLIEYLTSEYVDLEKDVILEDVKLNEIKYEKIKSRFKSKNLPKIKFKSILQSLNEDVNIHKLNYLYERLGNNFLGDTSVCLNILTDVFSLFDDNQQLYYKMLSKYGKDKAIKIIQFLHDNFVGFVGFKKNMITFRNIDKTSSFRYFKLNLVDNVKDYFVIDNMLTRHSKTPKVIMGEGAFDVLVPYILFRNGNYKEYFDADFYIASGKDYHQGLKFLAIEKSITRFDVIILSDSDVSIDMYDKIYKKSSKIINKMEVITNLCDKDFGVNIVEPTISKVY